MDWTANDNQRAEPLTPGVYHLTITRIIWRKKNAATDYTTQAGDPAPKLVVRSDDGREGLMTMTLSEKAAWTMRRLLSCSGADLAAMNAAKITIEHFKNPQWAETCLIKKPRRFLARVTIGASGHPEIEPIHEEEAERAAASIAANVPSEDDIPF